MRERLNSDLTWFKRYPRFSVSVFTIFILLLILAFTEWRWRQNGNRPGIIGDTGTLEIVDSLIVYPDFIADEYGITKINPEVIDIINKFVLYPGTDSLLFLNDEFNKVKYLGNEVTLDFKHFNEGVTGESEFGNFIRQMKEKPGEELSETDSTYLEYAVSPINSDGFRSIEFRNYQSDKKKVLLLGDSFTWGMSAQPIIQSFADILSARGYVIFNTGIAASDPAQYLSIAKVYIPELKPDVVVINFFMGNDEMDYYRNVEPYRPVYHYTNAGLLSAYPDRVYLEPWQAYETLLKKISIPDQEKTINRLMSKTVLTTRLWLLCSKIHAKIFISRTANGNDTLQDENPVTEWYIEEIEKICDANGSEMILVLIPYNDKQEWEPSKYENFKIQAEKNFKKTPYYYISDLDVKDFGYKDDHFSNPGMKKYADFLELLIDSISSGKNNESN